MIINTLVCSSVSALIWLFRTRFRVLETADKITAKDLKIQLLMEEIKHLRSDCRYEKKVLALGRRFAAFYGL